MPAKKGTRPPGRKRGVPNKVTQSAREVFAAFLEHNAPKAQRWLDRVAVRNPGKALDVLVKLADFFMPRLQRTEVTGANGTPLARHDAPITDAAEAARVYAQLMSGTEIDIGSVRFEAPAALTTPAAREAVIDPRPLPPDVAATDTPPDAPRESNVVELSIWEKLAK